MSPRDHIQVQSGFATEDRSAEYGDDCLSYAPAKCRAEPPPFRGGDISSTDVLMP